MTAMQPSARSPRAARSESTINAAINTGLLSARAGTLPVAALAAALLHEANGFDDDALVEALAHVVDGQRRDARRHHRLHFDAGGGDRSRLGFDSQRVAGPLETHVDVRERQRMR